MSRLRVTVVGAGKVGTYLAKIFHENNYTINMVVNKNKASAIALSKEVCAKWSSSIKDVPKNSDIIIISVPDPVIKSIADEISMLDLNFKKLMVFHVSGTLSYSILEKIKKCGATTFSMHPYQTFPSKELSAKMAYQVFYGIEGNKLGIEKAKKIVSSIKSKSIVVPTYKKIIYHSSAVMMSNFLLALLSSADDLLSHVEKNKKIRYEFISSLSFQAYKNYFENGFKKSITGPAVRRDMKTIEQHIAVLKKEDVLLRDLYKIFTDIIISRT
jgi:predicted short-subunit dehydrogenase-like oxidoreductase (DUF2520 family)